MNTKQYQLLTEPEDPDTWYHEFAALHHNSVYISDDAMSLLWDCIHRANNSCNGLGITVYSREKGQIQLLQEELQLKLNDWQTEKEDIARMIQDLLSWIENLTEDELTLIGTGSRLAAEVLGSDA